MEKKTEEFNKTWGKVIAKAWSDETFKKKLLTNPSEVLKEYGIESSGKMNYKIHENTPSVTNLVLPLKPQGSLSEKDLEKVAAGLCGGSGY